MDNSLKGRLPWTGVQYHSAWAIVVMAIILQVTTNFLSQAFGLLIVTLRDNFQWTLTAITLAYFFRWVVFGVLSPVAGWAGDRYGARRVLMFAAVLYIGGMLLLSTVARPWHLYIYYSVILGAAQALFSVNIPTTVAVWFRSKLGMAVGIQHSAGGMGASVMAPLLALLLLKAGWQTTFWIIPGVGGLIIFSVLFLFRSDPADKGVKPYGVRGDTTPTGVAMDKGMARLRTRVFMQHVRRTRAFWNLILIHYAGCVGHSIVMVGAVFFATSRGLSLEAAAWIISFYSLFSVCSRFATPILADRWGAKRAMAMAFFVQGVTVTLLFWTQEAWQFYGLRRSIRDRPRWRDDRVSGGQSSILRHGARTHRLRLPEPGFRPRNGIGRPSRQHHLRPIWLLRSGLGHLNRRQSDRGRVNPVAGVALTGARTGLGEQSPRRSQVCG